MSDSGEKGSTPKRRAVILAGGFGTRVQHLLPGIPKPMALVAGRPFMEWVIRFLGRQGIEEVILSTGYLARAVSAHIKQIRIDGVDIRCSAERSALGTAGGFLNAIRDEKNTSDPWLVCNGDSLVLADLNSMYAALKDPAVQAVVVGVRIADTSRYGSLELGEGDLLRGFLEKRCGSGLINAGMYLFRDNLIDQFPAYRPLSFEMDVFPYFLTRQIKIRLWPVTAPFLDIGTEETIKQAEDFISSNMVHFA